MAALLDNWAVAAAAERRRAMGRAIRAHFQGHWRAWVLTLATVAISSHYFGISVNLSESLPHHAYVILKWERVPQSGWYMAFTWGGRGPYLSGSPFVKQVVGVPGDLVTRVDREFFINGQSFGVAKLTSRKGVPLEPGPVGVIPAGRYYVYATHRDSLDSRYEWTGWIPAQAMRGRAIPIF